MQSVDPTFIYRTDSTIKTLMAYTINTGLLTRWVPHHVDQKPKTNFSSLLGIALAVTVRNISRNSSRLTIPYVMISFLFHLGLRSRWQSTTLWENVRLQLSRGASLTFFLQAMWTLCLPCESIWYVMGVFTFTPSPLQAKQQGLHPWPGIASELG